jgi:uridine kinase|tara:strand:+ start:469 stop:885 length:417 start_codon:yes stop_codon:yes gene_type:complete
MFNTISNVKMVVIGVALTVAALGGLSLYLYVDHLQDELQEQLMVNTANQVKIETQDRTIDRIQKDFKKQTDSLNTVIKRNNEIRAEIARYLEIFKKHDLTKLAAAKPGLIENRVNKATKNVFDQIETDSTFSDNTASK